VEIVSPLSGGNLRHFCLNFEFDSYRVKMVEVVEVYSSYDDCCGTCSHNVTRFNIAKADAVLLFFLSIEEPLAYSLRF
jgi:hypothetical protein